MFVFPIGDYNIENGAKPWFTRLFILVNIAVFVYEMQLGKTGLAQFVSDYGLIPARASSMDKWLTAWTSMFLHGGLMHLIGNMVFLFVFADNIEAVLGNFRFFLFYFLGGLSAALFQTLTDIHSNIPMIGASGCISACLGAYLVMFPMNKVKVLVYIILIKVPAFLFLGFWALQQFAAGYDAIIKTSDTGGVAYWAHIGGLVFGVIVGFAMRSKIKHFKLS